MVDSNLVRFFVGESINGSESLAKILNKFEELILAGRSFCICLPQRIELNQNFSKYQKALNKSPQNRTDEENSIVAMIESLSFENKFSVISEQDVDEIIFDKQKFNFAFSDLMIAYLARRNGWALISAERKGKPIQQYIEHYGLEP